MIFTGLGVPPKVYKTSQDIITEVKTSIEFIAYIDAKLVDADVKVIKIVK
jgi:hypothetical protein